MEEIVKVALEYALWPAVVLCGFFIFKSQVEKLVSGLRLLKAGSVEVVFDKRVKNLNLDKSKIDSLRDLTYEEISFFLLVSYSDDPEFKYDPALNTSKFHKTLSSLENAGLIEVYLPKDQSNTRHHMITPEGKRIRSIIVESTARLFQEHV